MNMSLKDRQKIMELIMVIIALSNKVNLLGILSLDDDSPSLRPDFLRKAVRLMVEGFNEEELGTMLDVDHQAMEYSMREQLEKRIIREGVLLILSGEQGKSLFEKILSLLRDNFFDSIDVGTARVGD